MANAGDSPFLFPSDLNRSGTRPLSRRSGTRLFGGPRFPTSESTTFDPRMPATECRRRSRRVVHTKASPGRRASLRKVFADEIADEARSSGNGKRSANEKKKNGALQRSANGKPNLSPNLLETGKRLRAFGNSLEPSRNKRHSRIFRRKREMTFNSSSSGPRSTLTWWIHCPIFPTPSRSSFDLRAGNGGWSDSS
jgi:hypothetical protein